MIIHRLLEKLNSLRRPKAPRNFQGNCERLELDGRIIRVRRVALRPFYDSTWEVQMLLEGQAVTKRLTRRDDETPCSLISALQNVRSREALKALDEREKIYYD